MLHERQGDACKLRMRFDFSKELVERESPATALLEDLDRLKFVLAEGRAFFAPNLRVAVPMEQLRFSARPGTRGMIKLPVRLE